jgi:hypothetical protein
VANKATLTIGITADTAAAVANLKSTEQAVKGYATAADDATKKTRDVSGGIETVGGVAGGATTGLRDMSDAIAMAGFPELAAGMGVTATALESLDGAATLYQAAQEGLTKSVAFFDGVMKALRLTILTNPIFLIAAVIVAIIAVVVILYMKVDWFRDLVDAAFHAIWSAIKFVYDWVKDHWQLLLTILTGPFGAAVWLITSNWDSIKAVILAVWEWIRDNFDKVKDWLKAPFEAAKTAIKAVFDWLKDKIDWVMDKIEGLKDAAGGIVDAVTPWSVPGMPAAAVAAPGVARAPAPRAATAGGPITINVTTSGLGASAPEIQRAVANALRGYTRRNGPLDIPVRQAG